MFCRRAWQRLAPLAGRVFKPASMNVPPVRRMAFGVPGGSTNVAYFVLCGGGLTAAVVYAYKTVNDDSERYEDRLANMSSKTALSSEAVPEESTPAAEPASEESAPAAEPAPAEEETEAASAAESVVESVPAISEPVAEISADLVTEAPSEEAVETEAVVEEAAAPVEEEAALDSAAAAAAEMSEAPAAESTDLPSAVKLLTSSTAEIAAASVGEEGPVIAVHQAEVDRIALEAAAPLEASEADLKPAIEEHASAEDEEAMAEETLAASAGMEDKEAPSEENLPMEEPDLENQVLPYEDEEQIISTEASPGDAASSEEASPVEETGNMQSMPEDITEAAVDLAQLAAASTGPNLEAVLTAEPEAPVQEAECCQSCHSAPSTGEEQLRPHADAPAEDLATKAEENSTFEAKEESSSLVEEQTTNSLAVLTAGL